MPLFEPTSHKALVVAPHADDEVLGAGGLMARLTAERWEIHVLYTTISGYSSFASNGASQTETRIAEVEAALKVLGVADYEALFLGEQNHLRLDAVPQAELIAFIEDGLARIRPYLVVTPSLGHYHQDHRAVAQACIAALRPAPGARLPFVPAVWAYGHGVSGWGGEAYGFRPGIFVDVGAVIETKIEALGCYGSQLCEGPHLRSLDKILSWSASWGNHAGVDHAEPFECLRLALL